MDTRRLSDLRRLNALVEASRADRARDDRRPPRGDRDLAARLRDLARLKAATAEMPRTATTIAATLRHRGPAAGCGRCRVYGVVTAIGPS